MEYTGDMGNHYSSLYSFITSKANHVFNAFECIPPDPWQSNGFIRRSKYFTAGFIRAVCCGWVDGLCHVTACEQTMVWSDMCGPFCDEIDAIQQ